MFPAARQISLETTLNLPPTRRWCITIAFLAFCYAGLETAETPYESDCTSRPQLAYEIPIQRLYSIYHLLACPAHSSRSSLIIHYLQWFIITCRPLVILKAKSSRCANQSCELQQTIEISYVSIAGRRAGRNAVCATSGTFWRLDCTLRLVMNKTA